MIELRNTAMGAALAGMIVIGCRDAPTVPEWPADSLVPPAFAVDSAAEPTGPADIISAYTRVDFYDGSHGGEPSAEILVGMEYIGNRAWMSTNYSITGDGISLSDKIINEQNQLFNPLLYKYFNQTYLVPTGRKCGLLIGAETQHQAWWQLWVRIAPDPISGKDIVFTRADPLRLDPCEPETPSTGGGDADGSSWGWIVIETCHYWAHYIGGVLVGVELRYCEYDTVPVADQ